MTISARRWRPPAGRDCANTPPPIFGNVWSRSLKKRRLMEPIERIVANDRILAYIIRRELEPAKTTFLTPATLSFQAGFIVYPANSEIARHVHKPIHRELNGTSEVLLV